MNRLTYPRIPVARRRAQERGAALPRVSAGASAHVSSLGLPRAGDAADPAIAERMPDHPPLDFTRAQHGRDEGEVT